MAREKSLEEETAAGLSSTPALQRRQGQDTTGLSERALPNSSQSWHLCSPLCIQFADLVHHCLLSRTSSYTLLFTLTTACSSPPPSPTAVSRNLIAPVSPAVVLPDMVHAYEKLLTWYYKTIFLLGDGGKPIAGCFLVCTGPWVQKYKITIMRKINSKKL